MTLFEFDDENDEMVECTECGNHCTNNEFKLLGETVCVDCFGQEGE